MLFNCVFKIGSSYHGGTNPYNEERTFVVEKDGVYYKFQRNSNHTYESFSAEAVNIQNVEIPSEFDSRDSSYHKWCDIGGAIEIEVSKYKILDGNEFLLSVAREELESKKSIALAEAMKKNPLYSKEYIGNLGLSVQEETIANAWRNQAVSEFMEGRTFSMDVYKQLFENLVAVVRQEAIVVVHGASYYSAPSDGIVTNNDILHSEYVNLFDLGQEFNGSYIRGTKPYVYNISKEVELSTDKIYLGSYYTSGDYPVDVYKVEGEFQIVPNLYTAWWNSQEWSKSLDRTLKVPRFFIETGSEEPFEEDNDIMEREKTVKKDFFLDTMKMAQYAFNVNWEGAKTLLEKAGTVRGLASLVEIKLLDLEKEELEILSKKRSNLALENFFKKRKMNLSNDSLADITIAAEKLLNM